MILTVGSNASLHQNGGQWRPQYTGGRVQSGHWYENEAPWVLPDTVRYSSIPRRSWAIWGQVFLHAEQATHFSVNMVEYVYIFYALKNWANKSWELWSPDYGIFRGIAIKFCFYTCVFRSIMQIFYKIQISTVFATAKFTSFFKNLRLRSFFCVFILENMRLRSWKYAFSVSFAFS